MLYNINKCGPWSPEVRVERASPLLDRMTIRSIRSRGVPAVCVGDKNAMTLGIVENHCPIINVSGEKENRL